MTDRNTIRILEHRRALVRDQVTRILLVDDDPILADLAKAHLTTPTTEVESAPEGATAWATLQTRSFDIVLLDIDMPVMGGFELLEKLRADSRFAGLPVVMLTGREDIESIDRAFTLGANSFITKPINWRQLSYALRYVLRTTRMETDLLRERKRSLELLQLTNSLLSLIKLEARTPLSAIIGYADCIRQEIDGPVGAGSYIRYAEQIGFAARQLQDGFSDLIQYAQLASGAAQLVDDEYLASRVMDAAVAGLPDKLANRPGILNIVKPDEDILLMCDRHWLARALRHLLEIAIEKKGVERVEFAMRHIPLGDAIFMITVNDGAVANNATGSTAETTTLESVRHQMGVGVPFARRIAELHDGELFVGARDGLSIMEIAIPAQRVIEVVREHSTTEAA